MKLSDLITKDTFIISDTHFGDYRMQEYELSRVNFANKLGIGIDDALIKSWNETIGEDDVVLHLGDFAYKQIQKYTKELNGIKILLRGNHDIKSADTYLLHGWDYVIETLTVEINGNVYKDCDNADKLNAAYSTTIEGQKILFTHFPLFGTDYKDEKYTPIKSKLEKIYKDCNSELNIHGHTHSKNLKNLFNFNASVENINFKPIRVSDILLAIKSNTITKKNIK